MRHVYHDAFLSLVSTAVSFGRPTRLLLTLRADGWRVGFQVLMRHADDPHHWELLDWHPQAQDDARAAVWPSLHLAASAALEFQRRVMLQVPDLAVRDVDRLPIVLDPAAAPLPATG